MFAVELRKRGFVSFSLSLSLSLFILMTTIALVFPNPSYWLMLFASHRINLLLFFSKSPKSPISTKPIESPKNNQNQKKKEKPQENSPTERIIPILLPLHSRNPKNRIYALRYSNDRHQFHQHLSQPPHQRLPFFRSLVFGARD